MSEGYGEHAERLAGYGVGSGELRDYTEHDPDLEEAVAESAPNARNIPQDAEASLTEWLDNLERNQRENEREVELQAWRDQEFLQEETDA